LTSNTQARALHVDPDEFDHLSIPADRYWAERAEREWS